ncbi:penicillin-binding protein 1A [Clostridium collagenovorans DSM 3089]|uniref:Penicillin-binding protein 1A n=1 Tax=Clostridium collagenovorans DSM 3089 TaxID=1121306 RepID=A0A1M5YDD3_9CLOT|nr:transglycosylase domain-containing protein [Clostridium collagenovorans]SHI10080.1 penicillin-binding protein 1A [Clostridium collagenovorans DSM 3089]
MSEDKKSKKTTKKSNKKTKKTKRKKSVFKILLISFLCLILTCFVAGGGAILAMAKTTPELDLELITSMNEPAKFYDDKGELIDTYLTEQKREPVLIDQVPEHLKESFVAIEDERFYSHNGIDLIRFTGAMLGNVKSILKGQPEFQGASTITQQLIKQRYFLEESLNNRLSIKRKVQEMYLALQLEKHLSKDKILEAYMNTIYLGGSAYGVKAAALQYFDKPLDELTLTESAFIASCAQSPSVSYSAAKYAFDNNELHESPRTSSVLNLLLKNNKISQEEYDEAIKPQLTYSFNKNMEEKMQFEWFSRPVIEALSKDLKEKLKYDDKDINNLLASGGLKIYTTMNTELQEVSQAILDDVPGGKNPFNSSLLPKQDKLQASAVVMDYRTGEVKTIVGGRGEQAALSYNRAASNAFLRAPGSAIKPLTVYAPGIDSKKITAGTVFDDTPIPENIGKKYAGPGEKPYNPNNSPVGYSGYSTVREAIQRSLNTISVKTLDQLGLDLGASYGEKFGLQLDSEDKSSMAALALGQTDSGEYNGTNPLTISAAYGTFGNNGVITEPILYTKVVDRNGKVLIDNAPETNQILDAKSSYIMWDLLKAPVSPGGTAPGAVFDSNVPVRGKTGTSSFSKDLWFAGLTPNYSGAVWVGTDDYSTVNGLYSNTMGQLWARIMSQAHKGVETKEVAMPSGITWADISKDSGTLPSDLTFKDPRGNRVYKEIFIDGTVPTTIDKVHVAAKVVKKGDRYVLASETSNPSAVEDRVFITRAYNPGASVKDQAYVLPTEKDDSIFKPEENKHEDKKPEGEESTTPQEPNKPNNGGENKPNDSNKPNTNKPNNGQEGPSDNKPEARTNTLLRNLSIAINDTLKKLWF